MARHDDQSSLNNATAYIVLRTARLLRFHLNKTLEETDAGISAEQWFILFKLWEHPGVQQNALADPVLNDEPNITRMVKGLIDLGMVTRTVDEVDRRRKLITLSDKGYAFMESFLPRVGDIRRDVFAGIDEDDIESFVDILHRIEDNIT